jgi:capsular polysaccharide transport system ATP-binding protein
MVTELGPFTPGVVVSATASARPLLSFRNFSLRCDKSDPRISFQAPWNWELDQAKRIAIITNSSFLRYQLSAALAGLIPPVSGEMLTEGVVGWPVGGEGGLDGKLRITHALNFLTTVYSDCLEKSLVSVDEFWGFISAAEINPRSIIKELSREQKDCFFLALSVLFSFDLYLISKTRYLMSRPAKPLRALLLKQLEGKTLFATSTNGRFQREFCTDGLVLDSMGQILFAGGISEAIEWADQNLDASDVSDSDEDQLEMGLNLLNTELSDDPSGDFFV